LPYNVCNSNPITIMSDSTPIHNKEILCTEQANITVPTTKHKPIVACLTGLAHSGKDTSADDIVQTLQNLGLRVCKVGLADRVKFVSQHLIKLFYNITIPIEDFYDINKKEEIRDDYPQFAGKPFKLRTILQLVGSEIFRDLLWGDIWCDYIKLKYLTTDEYDVVIISDSRFHNEISYFKDMEKEGLLRYVTSGRIVRPKREALEAENQNHQSEIHIMTLPVEHEIINDGSLQDLHLRLKVIIDPISEHLKL
jgi:hypothetical protein